MSELRWTRYDSSCLVVEIESFSILLGCPIMLETMTLPLDVPWDTLTCILCPDATLASMGGLGPYWMNHQPKGRKQQQSKVPVYASESAKVQGETILHECLDTYKILSSKKSSQHEDRFYASTTTNVKGTRNDCLKEGFKKVIGLPIGQPFLIVTHLYVTALATSQEGTIAFRIQTNSGFSMVLSNTTGLQTWECIPSELHAVFLTAPIVVAISESKMLMEREMIKRVVACVKKGGKVYFPTYSTTFKRLFALLSHVWKCQALPFFMYTSFLETPQDEAPFLKRYTAGVLEKGAPGCILFHAPGILHPSASKDVLSAICSSSMNLIVISEYYVQGTWNADLVDGKHDSILKVLKMQHMSCNIHYLPSHETVDARSVITLLSDVNPERAILTPMSDLTALKIVQQNMQNHYNMPVYYSESSSLHIDRKVAINVSLSLLEESFVEGIVVCSANQALFCVPILKCAEYIGVPLHSLHCSRTLQAKDLSLLPDAVHFAWWTRMREECHSWLPEEKCIADEVSFRIQMKSVIMSVEHNALKSAWSFRDEGFATRVWILAVRCWNSVLAQHDPITPVAVQTRPKSSRALW